VITSREQEDSVAEGRTSKPVIASGMVLGIGLGGFIDGILLHQVFQVHSMLSGKVPLDSTEHMRTNMTADGVFHSVMLVVTFVGIIMLFNAAKREDVRYSVRAFGGAMTMGWGIFNVVEGLLDHQILGLHHVVERLGLSIWDWLFLAASVVLIVVGWLMTKADRETDDAHIR
jgi:uncharacterized membrane protein